MSMSCMSAMGVRLLILIEFVVKFAIWIHAVSLSGGTKHSTNAICNSVNFVDGLSIIALSFSNTLVGICTSTVRTVPGGKVVALVS